MQDFARAGAGGSGMMFTFHLEACAEPQALQQDAAHPAVVDMCAKVKEAGMKVRTGVCGVTPAEPAQLGLPGSSGGPSADTCGAAGQWCPPVPGRHRVI